MDNPNTAAQPDRENAGSARSRALLESLHGQQFVSLTTYRRNGVGVLTPVSPVVRDAKLYFLTMSETGKVKRLRNNPRVTLAASTANGRLTGPRIEGTARRLSEAESAGLRSEFRRAWGIMGYLILGVQDLRRKKRVYFEVVAT
jgi:PPOX class probable F420-dependent enzyme